MIIVYFCIFLATLYILVKHRTYKDTIKKNLIKVKMDVLVKSDCGDLFASIFDVNNLLSDGILRSNYHFMNNKFFGDNSPLQVDISLDDFWNKYEKEKKNFEKSPYYRVYRLFLLNARNCGNVFEYQDEIHLLIRKYTIDDVRSIKYGPLQNVYIGGAGGGGGSTYSNHTCKIPIGVEKIGKMKCSGFKKIYDIWNNKKDDTFGVVFIIKKEEVEEFCNLCELISGEELSC